MKREGEKVEVSISRGGERLLSIWANRRFDEDDAEICRRVLRDYMNARAVRLGSDDTVEKVDGQSAAVAYGVTYAGTVQDAVFLARVRPRDHG